MSWPKQQKMITALQDKSNWLESGKPDAILFSGGGNDVAGDQFCVFLDYANPAPGGLNETRFEEALGMVKASYQDLFAFRDRFANGVPIFGHCYDFPIPNGAHPICAGPWLKPSLDFCGYNLAQGSAIVHQALIDFKNLLTSLEADPANNFSGIQCARRFVSRVYVSLNGLFTAWRRSGIVAQRLTTVAEDAARMQDLAHWLEKLGMSEYTQRFVENRVDFSVLPDLTDQDLEKLGVLLGDRRKMLRAIANPEGIETRSPKAEAAAPIAPQPHDTAERRQVTVMFSDLVGSTALSARMDPEDLREVISAYQKCVAETVQRFGGFLAKYMGDGVLVYFGYPQAHEDDAERAVRAGLQLIQAVSGLKSSAPLQARVGIATGLVVVGDLIGTGAAQEQAVVGETPNLAARLQSIAEPNTVVIGESKRKLIGNLFDLQDLGTQELKGIGSLARAWAVLRPASVESRFDALHASGLTELVGREEEIELLLRRWSKAKTGEGQAVLLSGEPGIGKSRLTATLLERLATEPHTRLRYFCSPQHTDSALYPIIGQMERAAGITHDDALPTKLDKLDAVLAQTSTSKQDSALFAEMLSLPNDGRYPALEQDPQRRRQRTLEALNLQMEVLSRSNPALMIVEDVHWSDPTSLEAFGRAVDRIASHRVLLIVTFRPEFELPWIGRPYVTALTINRLAQRDIEAMIDRVVGNKLIPANVRQDIIERTDGIPLFVEEMTKAVLEAGGGEEAQRTAAAVPFTALAVPASLHASLMARLDRLGPAKEIAQIGAAIGREFSHSLLAAVMHEPEVELNSALDRLIGAGLLFRQGAPPHATYLFKHALVQEAAYSTLLRSRRQQLHARITATMEGQFPEIVEAQPEVLARHSAEAGSVEKAVGYWLKAGQQAIARWAMTEAVAQLRKGLDLLSRMPDGEARQEHEFDLQIALGHALIATKGFAAQEPGETYARARQLCEQRNRPAQLGQVLVGQFVFRLVRGELDKAEHHAEEIRRLGEARNDVMWKCFGSERSGTACVWLGKFIDARAYFENYLSLWDPMYRAFWASPEDLYVASLLDFSRTLLCLGYLDQARLRRDEALTEARRHSPFTLAFALGHAWWGNWALEGTKSAQTMLRSADEILAIAMEGDFPMYLASGSVIRGWCLGTLGQAAEGIPLILEGLANWRATGCNVALPFFSTTLAEIYGMAARPEEGLDQLAEAATLVETTQERWAEAEMHRLRGTLLLSMDDHATAEGSFHQALAVARRQSAKFWELRAALDLARLWRDQGKRDEARELLAPVYAWFTEGFDTRDLKEAKVLLNEVAS